MYCTLGSPIKSKHMIAQTILSFPGTVKFDISIYLNLIEEPNVLHLSTPKGSYLSFFFIR